MQNLKTITVNTVTLPQVTYKGEAVLTAKAIAAVLETRRDNILNVFTRYKAQFVEGTHYYKLTASEARAAGFPHANQLVGALIEGQQFACYSSGGITFFTRRGLAKLSKTIGTPQAWAMMDTFIDAYFTLEGLATGSLTVQDGAAKAQEVVKRGQGLFAGIALQDTPSLPDGDHLRTAMALPVNRMASAGRICSARP